MRCINCGVTNQHTARYVQRYIRSYTAPLNADPTHIYITVHTKVCIYAYASTHMYVVTHKCTCT